MTLKFETKIADDLPDAVGRCLHRLNAVPTWTREKHDLFDEFEKLAHAAGYLKFTGDWRDYHLQRKGEHCLYMIPPGQRGALAVFAGKRVRLVCGGGWNPYGDRYFFAKPA